jgi:hypothetical protein
MWPGIHCYLCSGLDFTYLLLGEVTPILHFKVIPYDQVTGCVRKFKQAVLETNNPPTFLKIGQYSVISYGVWKYFIIIMWTA